MKHLAQSFSFLTPQLRSQLNAQNALLNKVQEALRDLGLGFCALHAATLDGGVLTLSGDASSNFRLRNIAPQLLRLLKQREVTAVSIQVKTVQAQLPSRKALNLPNVNEVAFGLRSQIPREAAQVLAAFRARNAKAQPITRLAPRPNHTTQKPHRDWSAL